jgi:subtilisin family serine protease
MQGHRGRVIALALAVAFVAGAGGLADAGTAAAASEPAKTRRIVAFRPGVPTGLQHTLLRVAGIPDSAVVHRLPQIRQVVVVATAAQAAALAASPAVEVVEDDTVVTVLATPNDPALPTMQGMDDIGAEGAWDTYPGSGNFAPGGPYTGAPVAIIDSGIDETHQEFQPFAAKVPVCVAYPPNPLYDPIDCTNHPTDTIAHGTHVAGTAAANADDGLGVPGVSPTSPIYVYKACQGQLCWVSDVQAGIVDATDDGAKVINMSLGGLVPLTTWQNAVNYAIRNDVVVAAAAGNAGNSSFSYPASFNGVLSVGALQTGTPNRASFSQYNSQVDIAAPGTGIISAVAPEAAGGVPNSYLLYSGTSMATPHVAGVAALVRSAHPTWSAGKVRGALLNTATDVELPGKDYASGYGRVNADAAIDYNPPADGDLDDDGVADEWDADPDDPLRWNIGSMSGGVSLSGTSVNVSTTNILGFIRFFVVRVSGGGRSFFAFVSSGTNKGTAVNGVTITGSGFNSGTGGFGTKPFSLKLVDVTGGDKVRVEVGGQLLANGTAASGNVYISNV